MDLINHYFSNINIYYSVIIYDDIVPYHFIKELSIHDYPIKLLTSLDDLDYYEIYYRLYVLPIDLFKELLFKKNNSIHEFTVIFCINDTYDKILKILNEEKPESIEKIVITKILI